MAVLTAIIVGQGQVAQETQENLATAHANATVEAGLLATAQTLAVAEAQARAIAESNATAEALARAAYDAKRNAYATEVVVRTTPEAKEVATRETAQAESRISLAQSLAAQAPNTNSDDELTTLLAVPAVNVVGESPGPAGWLIDRSLRDVLSEPFFNNTLHGHEDWVWSVAFSGDGRWLASGSGEPDGSSGTVRLWTVELGDLAEIGCRKVRRNLTRKEWNRYLPGQAYRKTCAQWPEGE